MQRACIGFIVFMWTWATASVVYAQTTETALMFVAPPGANGPLADTQVLSNRLFQSVDLARALNIPNEYTKFLNNGRNETVSALLQDMQSASPKPTRLLAIFFDTTQNTGQATEGVNTGIIDVGFLAVTAQSNGIEKITIVLANCYFQSRSDDIINSTCGAQTPIAGAKLVFPALGIQEADLFSTLQSLQQEDVFTTEGLATAFNANQILTGSAASGLNNSVATQSAEILIVEGNFSTVVTEDRAWRDVWVDVRKAGECADYQAFARSFQEQIEASRGMRRAYERACGAPFDLASLTDTEESNVIEEPAEPLDPTLPDWDAIWAEASALNTCEGFVVVQESYPNATENLPQLSERIAQSCTPQEQPEEESQFSTVSEDDNSWRQPWIAARRQNTCEAYTQFAERYPQTLEDSAQIAAVIEEACAPTPLLSNLQFTAATDADDRSFHLYFGSKDERLSTIANLTKVASQNAFIADSQFDAEQFELSVQEFSTNIIPRSNLTVITDARELTGSVQASSPFQALLDRNPNKVVLFLTNCVFADNFCENINLGARMVSIAVESEDPLKAIAELAASAPETEFQDLAIYAERELLLSASLTIGVAADDDEISEGCWVPKEGSCVEYAAAPQQQFGIATTAFPAPLPEEENTTEDTDTAVDETDERTSAPEELTEDTSENAAPPQPPAQDVAWRLAVDENSCAAVSDALNRFPEMLGTPERLELREQLCFVERVSSVPQLCEQDDNFLLTRAGVTALQEELNALRCSVGTVDGFWGNDTNSALTQFEQELQIALERTSRTVSARPTCGILFAVVDFPKNQNFCNLTCRGGLVANSAGTACEAPPAPVAVSASASNRTQPTNSSSASSQTRSSSSSSSQSNTSSNSSQPSSSTSSTSTRRGFGADDDLGL